MARVWKTPDEIRKVSGSLHELSGMLLQSAEKMQKAGMDQALLHWATANEYHISMLITWVSKLSSDVAEQVIAHKAGISSRAEVDKERNAKRKKLK